MTINQISRILALHSIPFKVVDNRILADEMLAFSEPSFTDVTDFTKSQLYAWLGY